MKKKNAIILAFIITTFVIGGIITIIGALFKILHWPYANEILTFSWIPTIIAGLLAIWFALLYRKEH